MENLDQSNHILALEHQLTSQEKDREHHQIHSNLETVVAGKNAPVTACATMTDFKHSSGSGPAMMMDVKLSQAAVIAQKTEPDCNVSACDVDSNQSGNISDGKD